MSQPTLKSSNGAPPAPASPSPAMPPATEVTTKAQRRTFTTAYKLQILQEADRCPPVNWARCCAAKDSTRRI